MLIDRAIDRHQTAAEWPKNLILRMPPVVGLVNASGLIAWDFFDAVLRPCDIILLLSRCNHGVAEKKLLSFPCPAKSAPRNPNSKMPKESRERRESPGMRRKLLLTDSGFF
jgi:hypothetical protein